MYSIQHYVIKFVSDLRQVSGFLRVLRFPPPIKHDRHDIAEILLKVALNTINQPTIIWAVAMTWCPSYLNFSHLLWSTEPIQEPKFVVYVLWGFLQKYFISFLTVCKAWLPLEILQVPFMCRLNTKFWKLTCPLWSVFCYTGEPFKAVFTVIRKSQIYLHVFDKIWIQHWVDFCFWHFTQNSDS